MFISSTFLDMQSERDHLVRVVFPLLREKLLARRIHLEDVDLRWGVTSDQNALELCTTEIDRCHPRFICLLGGRYGWVPPPEAIAPTLFEQIAAGTSTAGALTPAEESALRQLYPELVAGAYRLRPKPRAARDLAGWAEHCSQAVEIFQRAGVDGEWRSITASEVHYAALDRLDNVAFRFFYCREDRITNSIPPPHSTSYRDRPGSFSAAALANLKERIARSQAMVLTAPGTITQSALRCHSYPCDWDHRSNRITGLGTFGNLVLNDLLDSVDAELGTTVSEASNPLVDESDAMGAYVETQASRFVVGTRVGILDNLHKRTAAADGAGYIALIGEPGSGKSALMAKLYADLSLAGDDPTRGGPLALAHFVGASPLSSSIRSVLRRFCAELARAVDTTAPLSEDDYELRDAFLGLLEKAACASRVVLLIDGIDQLDDADKDSPWHWLPRRLPRNVSAVLTCAPGPLYARLEGNVPAPNRITLEGLPPFETDTIIRAFCGRFSKTLEPEQHAALVAKTDASKPLYLLAALEELRTLGSHDEISKRIEELPDETVPLFQWILMRLENDRALGDEDGRPNDGHQVVEQFSSYIAAARLGMAEAELAELIAPASPQADEEQHKTDREGNVAVLRRLLRPYLMQRGPLLGFYHAQLHAAVTTRYLGNASCSQVVHSKLATFFAERWMAGDSHALGELPYQQTLAGRENDVEATLCDLTFARAKCNANMARDLLMDCDRVLAGGSLSSVAQIRDAVARALPLLIREPTLSLQALCNRLSWDVAPAPVVQIGLSRAERALNAEHIWVRAEAPLPRPSGGHQIFYDEYSTSQALAFEGDFVVVATPLGHVEVRDTRDGHLRDKRRLTLRRLAGLVAGTDPSWLVYQDASGSIYVEHDKEILNGWPGTPLAFHPRLGVVAFRSDGTLVACDASTDAVRVIAGPFEGPFTTLTISRSGNRIFFVAGAKRTVLRIAALSDEKWDIREVACDAPIVDAHQSPDSELLLLLTADRTARVLDARNHDVAAPLRYEQLESPLVRGAPLQAAMGFADTAGLAFVSTAAGHILRWDWSSGEVTRIDDDPTPGAPEPTILLDTLPPDGRLFASWGRQAGYPCREGSVSVNVVRHQSEVSACCFIAPDQIVSASAADNTIRWSKTRGLQVIGERAARGVNALSRWQNTSVVLGDAYGHIYSCALGKVPDTTSEITRAFQEPVVSIVTDGIDAVLAASHSGKVIRLNGDALDVADILRFGKVRRRQRKILRAVREGHFWSLHWEEKDGSLESLVTLMRDGAREETILRTPEALWDATATAGGDMICVAGAFVQVLRVNGQDVETVGRRETQARTVAFLSDELLIVGRDEWIEVWRVGDGLPTVGGEYVGRQINCLCTEEFAVAAGCASGEVLSLSVRYAG